MLSTTESIYNVLANKQRKFLLCIVVLKEMNLHVRKEMNV